jgi:hypothetical protein
MRFLNVQVGSGYYSVLQLMCTVDSFTRMKSGRLVNMTKHVHIMPLFRILGSVPPFCIHGLELNLANTQLWPLYTVSDHTVGCFEASYLQFPLKRIVLIGREFIDELRN